VFFLFLAALEPRLGLAIDLGFALLLGFIEYPGISILLLPFNFISPKSC
jgi:hypothetical protein